MSESTILKTLSLEKSWIGLGQEKNFSGGEKLMDQLKRCMNWRLFSNIGD